MSIFSMYEEELAFFHNLLLLLLLLPFLYLYHPHSPFKLPPIRARSRMNWKRLTLLAIACGESRRMSRSYDDYCSKLDAIHPGPVCCCGCCCLPNQWSCRKVRLKLIDCHYWNGCCGRHRTKRPATTTDGRGLFFSNWQPYWNKMVYGSRKTRKFKRA